MQPRAPAGCRSSPATDLLRSGMRCGDRLEIDEGEDLEVATEDDRQCFIDQLGGDKVTKRAYKRV